MSAAAARSQRDAAPHEAEFAAPDGLLVVDKAAGMTSHDVVARVRRRLRPRAAGHLGTLDPDATGLLLVALGAATRCTIAWQRGLKTYEATLRLGIVTSTQDLGGEVLARQEPHANEDDLRAAAREFVGEISQLPPMVSALKHRGERLYDIARRGEEVERSPRRVHVHRWEWLGFALPDASFRVQVSGGTYVRTLAHDLGARLGCGAALVSLRRTRSEPFALDRCVTIAELDALPPDAIWRQAGLPLAQALAHLPALTLDTAEADAVAHGGRPRRPRGTLDRDVLEAGPRGVVLRSDTGSVLALGEVLDDPLDAACVRICPQVVFAPAPPRTVA